MGTLFVAAVVLFPVGAFGTALWRRREWRTFVVFLAAVVGIVGIAVVVGYQDYRSTVGDGPTLSDWGLEFHVTMFALLGLIAADWLALVWGGWHWVTRRRARPSHPTRADRRREARAKAAGRPSRGLAK